MYILYMRPGLNNAFRLENDPDRFLGRCRRSRTDHFHHGLRLLSITEEFRLLQKEPNEESTLQRKS